MRARLVGESAVLIECADLAEAQAAYAVALREAPDALDVVPAARTVLVEGLADPERFAAEVPGWSLADVAPPRGDLVELPVTYDGPDLDDVAELWGMSREEAIAHHQGIEHVVAFCGFAPGFAYCAGLAQEHAVPRLEDPRTSVPPGSVGLAGAFTGIYPTASPGGWRLIATTTVTLWRPDADPPALLVPGTRVRFVRD